MVRRHRCSRPGARGRNDHDGPSWLSQRHQCSIVAAQPRGRGRATDACGLIEGLTHTPEELSDSLGWPGERRGVQIAHSCHMSPVPSSLRTSLIPIGALPQGRTGRPDAGPKGTARLATVRSAGPGPAPSTSSTWPLFGCSTSAWSRHPVPTRHRLRACATRDSNPEPSA